MTRPLHIVLVAGEPSGDALGARLMAALRRKTGGGIQFSGVGGPRMEGEGLTSLFPMTDLALFGLLELVPRLPRLLRRLRETTEAVAAGAPDAVITIDSPGFTFRLARRIRARLGGSCPPLIHYVAPSVWAWRPERAAKTASLFDHLLALLPCEPPYFTREGLDCTFVGHSVVEGGAGHGSAADYRTRHGLPPEQRVLLVLPGSRESELKRLLPDFQATLALLAPRFPGLVAAVPTLPHLRARVAAAVAHWPVPALVTDVDGEKYDAMAAAEVALAASGTVALELALARLPAVVAYRLNPITVALSRRLIRTRYVNLINIMLDRLLVPELLQENCRPRKLAEAVAHLLAEPEARLAQQSGLDGVRTWLGEGGVPPSERAADAVLRVIGAKG